MKSLLLVAAASTLLQAARIPCVVGSGPCASEVPSDAVKVSAPGIRMITRGAGTASATAAPFITANGWRFLREPGKKYVYEASDTSVLAAAEAFAYAADAFVKPNAGALNRLSSFLEFLKTIPEDASLKPAANVAVVDDGSPLLPEVLNLLARRNLLFRVVKSPDPTAGLNVKIGSPAFPEALAANPAKFADEVRTKLTDRKRSLRIYGSESVLGRLETGAVSARVHLLNYTTSNVEQVRIRVLGSYTVSHASIFGQENAAVADADTQAGATEFTVPVMGPYAVIDLRAVK